MVPSRGKSSVRSKAGECLRVQGIIRPSRLERVLKGQIDQKSGLRESEGLRGHAKETEFNFTRNEKALEGFLLR